MAWWELSRVLNRGLLRNLLWGRRQQSLALWNLAHHAVRNQDSDRHDRGKDRSERSECLG